ncbi:hypothetical protein VPH35_013157 [Triticum aestivum]
MNALSWNCRGGGNSRTVRDLATLVQSHSPNFVFLSETRQTVSRMRRLRRRLGLQGFEGVDSIGISGGLALYWHESCEVTILGKDDRYIDVAVKTEPNGTPWRLTGVYGQPRVEDRHLMWDTLQGLKAVSDLPWLVIGDFNEAMWGFEHFSITPRPEQQMIAFRDALMFCELVDLGFVGVPYTYDNMRSGRANVRVRLDRAVASNSWRNLYAFHTVHHLASPSSDHVPLLLKGEADQLVPKATGRRYEIFWERDASLPEVIRKAWSAFGVMDDLGQVSTALRSTMSTLRRWSSKKFGNVSREINKSRSRLEELMRMNADRQEIREASDKLNDLLYKEEMIWLERSRITWLKEGDRNTRFFQSKAVW